MFFRKYSFRNELSIHSSVSKFYTWTETGQWKITFFNHLTLTLQSLSTICSFFSKVPGIFLYSVKLKSLSLHYINQCPKYMISLMRQLPQNLKLENLFSSPRNIYVSFSSNIEIYELLMVPQLGCPEAKRCFMFNHSKNICIFIVGLSVFSSTITMP